ncbi:MAG: hypothetical protein JOZ25_08780 [Actinobacteria bacterium]|nr:hypothetical protein [Actinomycetota bacterium]
MPLTWQGRMRRKLRIAALAALLVAASCAFATTPPASAGAPRQFFGMSAWNYPSSFEFLRMAQGGVGTFRVNFYWPDIEVREGAYNWSRYDALFADAARVGIRLLPTVWGSPSWAAQGASYPPTSHHARKAFASFLRTSLGRYGTNGFFWRTHSSLPTRPPSGWEVWNEPSHWKFWQPKANPAGYVKLLRLAAQVIRKRDPSTKVVLGGIPNVYGDPAIPFIKQLYKQKGFRGAFDIMNVHPYSQNTQALEDAMAAVRRVMANNNDSKKPIWITEIGWASSGPKGDTLVSGRQGQAKELKNAYNAMVDMRKQLNIGMVVWFSWRDHPLDQGEADWWGPHTGLFDLKGKPKPAWNEYVKVAGGKAGSGHL